MSKRNARIARRDKVSQVIFEVIGWIVIGMVIYGLCVWAILSRPA